MSMYGKLAKPDDSKGGRTAWSCTVTVQPGNSASSQQILQARFWYDGEFLNNAREDAAEVALLRLTCTGGSQVSSPTIPTSQATSSSPAWGSNSAGGSATGYGGNTGGRSYNVAGGSRW